MNTPPNPEPSKDNYAPLKEMLDKILNEGAERARMNAVMYLAHLESDDSLLKELRKRGFRRFAPLTVGSHGFILETTQNQIIRITDHSNTEKPRARVHEELQPITTGEAGYFSFEILPKVPTKVRKVDADQFVKDLKSKEYIKHFDTIDDGYGYMLEGDLGYLPNGKVVGVDKEAIVEKDMKRKLVDADKERLVEAKPGQKSIFDYVPPGYITDVEDLLPAIADGRARGVLSDDDINALRNGKFEELKDIKPECFTGITEKNLGEFIKLVDEQGWYPSQAQEIMTTLGMIPDKKLRSPDASNMYR